MIVANATNYSSYLNILVEGDTLYLEPGNYTNNLKLIGRNGTAAQPIVILGSGSNTVFQAQSCCNTISITQCSYLIIKNLKLDGMHVQVDAVKAEGTSGNWAHHITLEYLNIVNYDGDQQNVGISTKCPVWNWTIRKNKLQDIGTGMYLGNSSGDKPFVNGIIEYNYIANTIGYNIEIKHQLSGVRDEFPGIAVDGKTIIRHNVFTKNEKSSTGGSARPNVLVGGFPPSGWGSMDYYEIYGNLFYNNPVEALFQGTGNIMLYENIFVNHFDPSGFRAVYITPHNNVSPQDIKIVHNTVWVANSSGGIRLYNPNTNFKQYCYANAVFAASAITNFTNNADNITDSYTNAGNYVISANQNINILDLYPKSGQLTGTITSNTIFKNNTHWDIDFNGDQYDWTYRGAYSGCCVNHGWHLQLDTIAEKKIITSEHSFNHNIDVDIFPNPANEYLILKFINFIPKAHEFYNVSGQKIKVPVLENTSQFTFDVSALEDGIYFIKIVSAGKINTYKFIKIF
jgi:hypothetical protein